MKRIGVVIIALATVVALTAPIIYADDEPAPTPTPTEPAPTPVPDPPPTTGY